VLGGLADYVRRPAEIAIDVESGQLQSILEPLASNKVTTILGFTETDRTGRLYNSAAVFHKGSILGIYRKLHTAINKSIYVPGNKMPIFTVGDLTFGIVICLDSTYDEPAKVMVSQGASALFIPSNNSLPPAKGGPELVSISRKTDIARAAQNQVSVIRADVAGRNNGFVSFGSSRIVDASGTVLQSAQQLVADLIVAEIVPDRSTIQ
jgi:predicted amidohydrolase